MGVFPLDIKVSSLGLLWLQMTETQAQACAAGEGCGCSKQRTQKVELPSSTLVQSLAWHIVGAQRYLLDGLQEIRLPGSEVRSSGPFWLFLSICFTDSFCLSFTFIYPNSVRPSAGQGAERRDTNTELPGISGGDLPFFLGLSVITEEPFHPVWDTCLHMNSHFYIERKQSQGPSHVYSYMYWWGGIALIKFFWIIIELAGQVL